MRNFDFAPLYRATVGFDQIADMFDRVLSGDVAQTTYPPYNIEKTADDAYRISIAVAGFSDADLSVEVKEGALIVSARKADEEILLDFVVHWFKWFQRTKGTIKSKLMAVRYQHVAEGFSDPLKAKARLFLALGGIKRATPAKPRSLPVTVPMMEWSHWRYHRAADDEFVIYAAAVMAWFFLSQRRRSRGGRWPVMAVGASPHWR